MEQQPNLSEHEAAMVAAVDANEQKTKQSMQSDAELNNSLPQTEQEEEKLYAGKYKSIEDMEKAYKELESKLGGKEKTETNDEKTETPTEQGAQETVEKAGLDFEGLTQEYLNNGALSEDTYKSLAEAGIGKEVVDAYIAGQNAIQEAAIVKMQALAGGEQGFNDMLQWASENLTESEQKAYDQAVMSDGGAEMAIKGLYARYKMEAGEPNLVQGDNRVVSQRGYASKQEMMADMHSPRYKTDAAFRTEVQRKLAKSNF